MFSIFWNIKHPMNNHYTTNIAHLRFSPSNIFSCTLTHTHTRSVKRSLTSGVWNGSSDIIHKELNRWASNIIKTYLYLSISEPYTCAIWHHDPSSGPHQSWQIWSLHQASLGSLVDQICHDQQHRILWERAKALVAACCLVFYIFYI